MKTTNSTLSRIMKPAIFGALALSCGSLSIAGDNSDMLQVAVKFGDLNLSNPQGAAQLYNRIVAAAHQVCKPVDLDIRELGAVSQRDACLHKAIADAVTDVGKPELLAVYNAKNAQPRPIMVAAARSR
jgi:UrcA family protein